MSDQYTRAGSIQPYHSGAASDGAAQTDPDACLGGFRSGTRVQFLACAITSPIANITVNFVSGLNGTGAATLEATGNDTLRFTAPSGSAGPEVTILNGETKQIEDGADAGKFVEVTRTSASNLSGTATLTLTDVMNNVVGFDNVNDSARIESVTFAGSGLDDATSGGTFSGSVDRRFVVKIDAEGTPDTFTWSKDGGSTWDAAGVAITGAAQTLTEGVTVTFAATTGHTLNTYWNFQVSWDDYFGNLFTHQRQGR